jgi:putative ABC transport system ATP-binding protein
MREGGTDATALLALRNVVKHYAGPAEPVRAVDGVSLELGEGELIALHGPSGSGKTTLLLLVAALLAPDRGEIRFRGEALAGMGEARACAYLRRDVGFIHQGAQLMPHVSALENAAVKLLLDGVGARAARRRARPWLQRLGLGERLAHTPEQLSGGERQRVSIARALAGEPSLILADEPTGNLDTLRSAQTIALLRQLAHEHGTSVLLVTHDRDAAALADRAYELRDGRLAEAPPASVAAALASAIGPTDDARLAIEPAVHARIAAEPDAGAEAYTLDRARPAADARLAAEPDADAEAHTLDRASPAADARIAAEPDADAEAGRSRHALPADDARIADGHTGVGPHTVDRALP